MRGNDAHGVRRNGPRNGRLQSGVPARRRRGKGFPRTIARELGVSGAEVMDTLCRDTRLNISPAYLKPGFRYAGEIFSRVSRHSVSMTSAPDTPSSLAMVRGNPLPRRLRAGTPDWRRPLRGPFRRTPCASFPRMCLETRYYGSR